MRGTRYSVARVLPGLAVAAVLPAAALLGAQGTQFRSSVDLIQVDVSVLDATRRPVRGLTAADFILLEDEQPQQIANFALVDASGGPAERSASEDVVRNSPSGFIGDGRLVVIFMDDTTIWLPRDMITAVTSARAIIGQLTPNDLAAVVYASGIGGVDYTNDRARLLGALSTFSRRTIGSLIVRLVHVAQDLAAVPDRRKILFYVGVGIPFRADLLDDALEPYGDARGQQSDLVRYMQDIFRSAQLANMSIYTLDPSGLQAPTRNAYDPNRANRDFLQIVAGETGGRAIVNLNEPALEVPRAFRENDSYYLIGYRSTNPAKDGKFRRLKVRVNREGVTVRARSGYYALPPGRFPTAGPRERARAAMNEAAYVPELPLRLAVAPVAAPRLGDTASAAVQLGFEAPLSGRPGVPETIDVVLAVYNDMGAMVERREKQVAADLGRSDSREVVHQMLEPLAMKPGGYQISVTARARERNAHGSVLARFVVPDFNRAPLSVSGVIISEPTPPAGTSAEAFGGRLPAVPTTERVFPVSAQATAAFRVYQGTRPAPGLVTVSIRITDERGDQVREHAETLDAGRFGAGRSADVSYPLPLSALTPGAYTLVIHVSRDGQPPIYNRVAFGVRG